MAYDELKEKVADKIQEAAVISSGVEDVWQWPSGWDVTIELAAEEIVAMVRQHEKANRKHLTVRLNEGQMASIKSSTERFAQEFEDRIRAARDAEIREAFATILEKYAKDTVWVNDHTTALDALDAAIGRAEGGQG